MLFAVIAAVTLAQGVPTPPSATMDTVATPAAANVEAAPVVKKKDRVVCERIRVTGSWQSKRVCRTVDEKERTAEAARRRHENMTMRQGRPEGFSPN